MRSRQHTCLPGTGRAVPASENRPRFPSFTPLPDRVCLLQYIVAEEKILFPKK
jgi:hypothetical protein